MEDKDLMFKLYKNGLSINFKTFNGANPGCLVGTINRLDLLKRRIGLNVKDLLPSGNEFIEKIYKYYKG